MKRSFILMTVLFVVSCTGENNSSDSSSSFESVTHTLDYSSGVDLPGDCATQLSVSVSNDIFSLSLVGNSSLDFADFIENSNSAASGIANYAAFTNDTDYDEGICLSMGYDSYIRSEVSMFGAYSSSAGVNGSFVYQNICDDNGSEVSVSICSGNISK